MSVIITPNMCMSCKHGLKGEDPKDFFCRRFPPVTYMLPTPQGIAQTTAYARTQPTWTCGEFEKGVITSNEVLP